jgi:CRISPR-associated endonuclease Cas1
MQGQATATSGPLCVAHGYGVKIHVHRGHLVIEDGIGRKRRSRRFHRATSKLRRLVLIGHTGYVTLDALRWLADAKAALLHIDADGRLLTISASDGLDLATLRRAQALSDSSPTGVEIARSVLGAKVSGQRAVLAELPGGLAIGAQLDRALIEIEHAPDLDTLLGAEAQAAGAYWGAWAELPLPFSDRDALSVPDHWRTFGQRHSLLSGSPRQATNPAGAILNYLYTLLEAETILACRTVGLDPGLGIFHVDRPNRSSLALDLMEATRPVVDAYVLALLTQRTLSAKEFGETRNGACRLAAPLAARLAETASSWGHHTGPVVEAVAQQLGRSAARPLELSTPLTRANHRAAWGRRNAARRTRQPRSTIPALPATCRTCGGGLPDRRFRYCTQCKREEWAARGATGREAAATVLVRLREEGRNPGHGGRAAEARGAKNAAHQRAVRAWHGEAPDAAVFDAEILGGLRHVPIADLVSATGLSEHYCSLIRLGKKTPHPRHWDALRTVLPPTAEP